MLPLAANTVRDFMPKELIARYYIYILKQEYGLKNANVSEPNFK